MMDPKAIEAARLALDELDAIAIIRSAPGPGVLIEPSAAELTPHLRSAPEALDAALAENAALREGAS